MHMLSKRGFELTRWAGYSAEIQDYDGGNSQRGGANKRGSTSVRSRSWSLRDGTITGRHACNSITWKALRRKRVFPWVVKTVQNHGWAKMGGNSFAKRTISSLLLFLDCRQVLVPDRLLHRHRRIHQVILRIHNYSEVTSKHRETRRDSTKPPNKNEKESNNQATGDRLRDLPGWLEEFTDNLEDTETPVLAHVSRDSESERPTKVVSKFRKHSIYTHFPKDRNCEVCLRTKMTKALCRRPTDDAVPRATEFGDLLTADHTVLNEEGESRNHHWYAVVPCKNQASRETERSSRKFVSRAVRKAESHLHQPFVGTWQILWRSIMESTNAHSSSIWDKWHFWDSSTKSKRSNMSSIVTIGRGWKMVGWFYGMLLLSAKCPRPPGRRENSLRKAIRRKIQGSSDTCWGNGWI